MLTLWHLKSKVRTSWDDWHGFAVILAAFLENHLQILILHVLFPLHGMVLPLLSPIPCLMKAYSSFMSLWVLPWGKSGCFFTAHLGWIPLLSCPTTHSTHLGQLSHCSLFCPCCLCLSNMSFLRLGTWDPQCPAEQGVSTPSVTTPGEENPQINVYCMNKAIYPLPVHTYPFNVWTLNAVFFSTKFGFIGFSFLFIWILSPNFVNQHINSSF